MKKYIVRDGDTMWKVSKATGVRLNLLMAANPQVRDPNQLQSGSVLSIPELGKESTGPTPHSSGVPSGPAGGGQPTTTPSGPDAAGLNTGPPVPVSAGASDAPYFGFVWPHVVKPTETWGSVAKTYHIPVDSLRRMNPRQSESLQAGDILYVPGAAGQVPGGPGAGQGHVDATTGTPTSVHAGPVNTSAQQQGWPQMPPGMQHPLGSGWPQMPGPGQVMPQMPGYEGSAAGMPGYAPADGPHAHTPYRNPWYDAMVLPPYPVYVPAAPDGRYAGQPGPQPGAAMHSPAGMAPDVSYQMWLHSQQALRGWNADWDESSAWESSWSSTFPPANPGWNHGEVRNDSAPGAGGQEVIDPSPETQRWRWPDAFGAKDGVRDTPESST